MDSDHPYRRLAIPPDAPFELRPSPGKGFGAFATRKIEKHTVILREEPLFVIFKPFIHISESDIRRAFNLLSTEKKIQFMSIRRDGNRPFSSMYDAFLANNCFIKLGDEGMGMGMYVLLSRLNNSCSPNVGTPPPEGTADAVRDVGETIDDIYTGGGIPAEIVAARDISAGEEITRVLTGILMGWTSSERRSLLPYSCDCRACVPGTTYQLLSDLRRRLIRGLHYLVTGQDLGSHGNPNASCPILDPELRNAAKTFTTPSTCRFVQCYLFYALVEKEGIIYTGTDHMPMQAMLITGRSFRSKKNRRILKLIDEQETYLQKFCVAANMYGRPDASDQEAAIQLREWRSEGAAMSDRVRRRRGM